MNARQVNHMLQAVAQMFIDKQQELSELDRKIGDGDHGVSMARGAEAALTALNELPQEHTINKAFLTMGHTFLDYIGGAMGPLFGSIFLAFAEATLHEDQLTVSAMKKGFILALDHVVDLGGASPGDKTLVDAMTPTAECAKVFDKQDLALLLKECTEAAHQGVLATIPLIAKRGRSKYRKAQSAGFQDAGATSFYYFVQIMTQYVIEEGA